MYLCFASSNEYAKYTGVAVASVLENNQNVKIDGVIILSFGIEQDNIERLLSIINRYGRKPVIIDAGTKMQEICKNNGISAFRGSLATYSRAFIEELVPVYVEKMLYIDTDTVTIGSIEELEREPLKDVVMAAVVDTSRYDRCYTWSELKNKPQGFAYHSCGVLLFNLIEWRKRNCRKLIEDEIASGRTFKYADQSLINNAIPQEWIQLMSYRFNYWGHMYPIKREKYELNRGGFYSEQEIEDAISRPVIVHYPGLLGKAWFKESVSRRAGLYADYLKLTPWAGEPLDTIEPTLKKRYKDKGVIGNLKLFMFKRKAMASSIWESKLIERIESIIVKE